MNAFLFGITSYAILFALEAWLGNQFELDNSLAEGKEIFISKALLAETMKATVIAITASILWVYATNYQLIIRFLGFIRATKSFGDEDVWTYLMNSNLAETEFINLRDFEKKLVYTGYVVHYSEKENLRELYLHDVKVYDFDANEILDVPNLYLSFDPKNVHLEFPY